MANGVITWNGVASNTLGITVRKVPGLNRPQRKHDSYSVPGRNGNIVVMQDAFEEYEQEYEIFTLDNAQADAREIVDWLYQDGYCKLTDDWEPGYYRLAYFVGPLDVETILEEAAVCTIKFRCRPERYIVTNPLTPSSGSTITNITNHVAEPIITLTGSGARSMLRLEDRTIWTNSRDYSSTQFNELVPYRNTKWYLAQKMGGTDYFFQGSGGATITSAVDSTGVLEFTLPAQSGFHDLGGLGIGFIVEVAPGDYAVSCEINGLGWLWVSTINKSGYNQVINSYGRENWLPSDWHEISISVNAPSECGYLFILFASQGSVNYAPKFRNIMLNKGAEVLPFRGYYPLAPSSLTLNNTVLTMQGAFDIGIVDCERENVAIDGINSNGTVSLRDTSGNLSADYLKLNKGNNTISFDGEIAAISIDPRFWEL